MIAGISGYIDRMNGGRTRTGRKPLPIGKPRDGLKRAGEV